ncbi:glycoside hydrolase family 10 protein [Vampirovibrio chlorellavorus]|uniref:glycoside hydrolase family 10 protein n=1 Tax=Vampirovibrio chlorellavorus TaxID=758823 RepID=UPI0026EFCB0E|nr:family 10 glycosylhydrolase [Vampirovibrio chlorellavorus]
MLAFQLSGWGQLEAWAAQRLPVYDAEPSSAGGGQGRVLKSLEDIGYQPHRVKGDDFLFSISPGSAPYVLVPLSGQLDASALAMLNRYLQAGGHLVLFPGQLPLSPSAQRLVEMVGLTLTGSEAIADEQPLFWSGTSQSSDDVLRAGSRLLRLQPSVGQSVLATWGERYPALITTAKGALLNWPSGQRLSRPSLMMALAKAMPLAPPDSVVLKTGKKGVPGRAAYPLQPAAFINGPLSPQEKEQPMAASQLADPKGAASDPASRAILTLSPPPAGSTASNTLNTPLSAQSQTTAAVPPQAALAVAESLAVAEETPERFMATLPSALRDSLFHSQAPSGKALEIAQAEAKSTTKAGAAAQTPDAEAEVLDNILGRPEQGAPPAATGTPAGSGAKAGEPGQPQKRFSFLDPEAASVIAPEFDYGTYSYNLRVLDDYRRRIHEATETAKQLSMEIPDEKIRKLLWEAHQNKRKFESLYLNGQTQAGLDAYAEARRLTLKALALTSDSPRVEGRAIWLDRGTIVNAQNPEGLKKVIQKLHQAGINIVYFETVNAGFPIYPSAILKSNPLIQDWDPLKVAVEEGHRLGMEVHAWVWAFAVGNRRHNPLINQPVTYPGPMLSEAGLMSEALRNSGGGLEVDGRQHEFWLDPASEKGRAFLLSVYREIVSRYEVDGLQLDYIRYPFQTAGTRMGYDAVGRDRFYRATGQTLDNLDDYTAKLWIAWKTYQVSSFVQQVSSTLRGLRPAIKISAAVFPMRRESRIVTIQQDWETWIENGWVDTLSPMSYTTDPERLQGMFDYVQSSPQKRSLIYPGIALHRLDGGQLVQHVEALRERGGLGVTLFAGAHLDSEKIEVLGNGPFKAANSLPPHRDVIKSLQLILDDYHQKFSMLQSRGALANLPVPQVQTIESGLSQLAMQLRTLAPFKNPATMPPDHLMAAQQALSGLQTATDAWVQAETENRYRARYFNHKVQLLSELLGYVVDKSTPTAKAFRPASRDGLSQAPSATAPKD